MPKILLPLAAALLLCAPAFAEKPEHAGGKHKDKSEKHQKKQGHEADKHDKHDKHGQRDGHGGGPRMGAYFDERQRESVRHYYASHEGKKCPPGLAKKNNGCMPPGQARKWHVGQRLPSTVTVYSVPQPILVTLPPPPPQHRYVRVGGDVLLIAIGTMLVIDGMNGLMN